MLTEAQIRRYARQVIVSELGQDGQARLCATRVAIHGRDAQPEVARVASDYLQRAGLAVVAAADAPATLSVALPDAGQVEPALRACADWLLGAWTAVETIKRVAGAGEAAAAPDLGSSEVG